MNDDDDDDDDTRLRMHLDCISALKSILSNTSSHTYVSLSLSLTTHTDISTIAE